MPAAAAASAQAKVFSGITVFLNDDLGPEQAKELKALLDTLGAGSWDDLTDQDLNGLHSNYRFDPSRVTHVVTTSIDFPEYASCSDPQANGIRDARDCTSAIVVSPDWVRRSYVLGARQQEAYFCPDPTRIFSGVFVVASRLGKCETELLQGAVQAQGGAYLINMTKEATHLVTPHEDSIKLAFLRRPESRGSGILAVHPAWINECTKFNTLIDPTPFLWPLDKVGKPPVVNDMPFALPFAGFNNATKVTGTEGQPATRLPFSEVVKSVNALDSLCKTSASDKAVFGRHKNVLQGKSVLYSKSPNDDVSTGMLDTLAFKVHQCGGNWIPFPSNPASVEQAVINSDVIIAPNRDMPAVYYAFYHSKQVATASWLWTVMTTGRMLSSFDNLLYFPPPSKHIPGFDRKVVTISNYSGETRAYLKHLLLQMGAKWTPEMSMKNSHCVCAKLVGAKATRATEWGIPVVNHLWVEDCYMRWQNVPIDASGYKDFPPGVDYRAEIGKSRLDADMLRPWVYQADEYTRKRGRATRSEGTVDYLMPQPGGEKHSYDAHIGRPEDYEMPPPAPVYVAESPSKTPRTARKSAVGSTSAAPPKTSTPPVATASLEEGPKAAGRAGSGKGKKTPPTTTKSSGKATQRGQASSSVQAEAPQEAPAASEDEQQEEEEEEDAEERPTPSRGPKRARTAGVARGSTKKRKQSSGGATRFFCTTGAELTPAQVKAMGRLGWQLEQDWTDRTGALLAGQLNRTEKTLRAIAAGKPIVGTEWTTEMIESGEDLDPEEYILQDKVNEKKRGVSLKKSIELSRAHPEGLLHGHRFFFTRNVHPSSSILKSIVTDAGATVSNSEMINTDALLPHPDVAHLISCQEDKKLWEPLKNVRCTDGSKLRVWTPELIVDGVFKQQMAWSKHLLLK